jgi:diguanylate cyclase (GGDEF)-like protein/PAS domain S-box-containing protein
VELRTSAFALTTLPVRVLLIADDAADVGGVQHALADALATAWRLKCVNRLSVGLAELRRNAIEAVLLNMNLPDSQGIATFERVSHAAPAMPILILGSTADRDISRQSARLGPQEFFLRSDLNGRSLPQAIRHVIARKRAEEAVYCDQQRAEVTLNSIGDAVLSTDISGNLTYLNPVAEHMTGWSRIEALGRPVSEVFQIVDATTQRPARNPMAQAMALDKIVGMTPNCVLVSRDGIGTPIEDSASPIHDRQGNVIGAVIVFKDVSEARALSEQAVYLAQHDFVTGLPNRMVLNDRLTHAIAVARRQGHRLAVLFLDLDRFKHVNDSLGHVIGDSLLQAVARRLAESVRSSDTVSRYGGDEFVVLLSEVVDADDAAVGAQKILDAILAPYEIAGHQLHVTGTIGISVYPGDGLDAETLMKGADTAMYHAKENGHNSYRFFEKEMNARAVERQSLEVSLRRALARHEFVLHYQPKIDLETGLMTGAEALIRWIHPQRGLMFPGDFVPIAEDSGLIVPIGQWVLREACRQAQEWIDLRRRPMAVAVNVSPLEFRNPQFLDNVRAALHDSKLDPRYLEIELTERSLIQHLESTAATLKALKEIGIQVAIDDFGTGYSNLSYLRQFPVNVLKVDQSFVREISSDRVSASIVCAVISMGKSLGHRVVAEGVETREQLEFLQAQRCGEGQGYYFSRPLVPDQFVRLLEMGLSGLVVQ